ncbi:MAG: RNA polymerase sigma factor, partial [Candidatus Kapabacteria bacterium]|nr:RNA polymerase sigma factor [Candidatus Kapabacteria bacterium]
CGGYLMRTIRNLCLNHKRDTKLHEEYSDDMTGEQLNANLEEKDLLAAVAKGLQRVSFDLREVFVLRYYHSMEYEEIAAITGESINTVRTRVWRAKEKLKHILLPIIREVNE